jgi:GntR family phosphonate transport system transcriptional regulator
LISIDSVPATEAVADALALKSGTILTSICTVATADGQPISFGRSFLEADAFPDAASSLKKVLKQTGRPPSTSELLELMGVKDFRRKTVRIRSRLPDPVEAEHLSIALVEYVLETDVTNVDEKGRPVTFARRTHASTRVEFIFDL